MQLKAAPINIRIEKEDRLQETEVAFTNLQEVIQIINNIESVNEHKVENVIDLHSYLCIDNDIVYLNNLCHTEYNLLNGTYGKKNVPTLSLGRHPFENVLYCPKCKKSHNNLDYSGKIVYYDQSAYTYYSYNYPKVTAIDTATCLDCNITYNIKDLKLIQRNIEYIGGNVYIDGHKISLSLKYMYNDVNRHGNIYYDEGYKRVTFNTKTGFTYTTIKGYELRQLKKVYAQHGKKAPTFFNSTYTNATEYIDILQGIAYSKLIEECKAMTQEELRQHCVLGNKKIGYNSIAKKRLELLQFIADTLYDKVQENFSYKLPTDIKDIEEYNCMDSIRKLKNFNRFVNILPGHEIMDILMYYPRTDVKINKVNREEVNLLDGLLKTSGIKVGKKTRALFQQNLYDRRLASASIILLQFKNPSNINKIANAIINNKEFREYGLTDYANTIKDWLKYRDENYITAKFIEHIEFYYGRAYSTRHSHTEETKMNIMRDVWRITRNIQANIPDININDIAEFKNEKQFHDDLIKFCNSDEYNNMVSNQLQKHVFDLEDTVLELEEKENRIYIAKTAADLNTIGRKMSICVGGYVRAVDNKTCRIAYIMDDENKEYKACLELRPADEGKYILIQAKLKYNRRPCQNMDIYNKIQEWTERNNILISTCDMELPTEEAIVAM